MHTSLSRDISLIKTHLRRSLVNETGFTLIEMIIVIAILGILAVVVITAINPAERQAQARDAGRKTTVLQLGHAAQSFGVANNGNYPVESTWAQDLVGYGDLATFPAGVAYASGAPCSNVVQPFEDPTFCYAYDATNGFLVYSVAESQQSVNKCTSTTPYFVFSSADSRGGTICSASEPTPWISGSATYVD